MMISPIKRFILELSAGITEFVMSKYMDEKFENSRDSVSWSMARNRVAFKRHLTWYLVMNASFRVLWFLRSPVEGDGIPWTVFPMVLWGTGLCIHFAGTYIFPIEFEIVKRVQSIEE